MLTGQIARKILHPSVAAILLAAVLAGAVTVVYARGEQFRSIVSLFSPCGGAEQVTLALAALTTLAPDVRDYRDRLDQVVGWTEEANAVSERGPRKSTSAVASHWSFWSESCDHLADVFICLTLRDTVVVDPTALQGQIQFGQGNENTGPFEGQSTTS